MDERSLELKQAALKGWSEERALRVLTAFELYGAGTSMKDIADQLGCSPVTLYKEMVKYDFDRYLQTKHKGKINEISLELLNIGRLLTSTDDQIETIISSASGNITLRDLVALRKCLSDRKDALEGKASSIIQHQHAIVMFTDKDPMENVKIVDATVKEDADGV